MADAVRTVLRGAKVFDGSGAPVRTADVCFEGDRIVSVEEGSAEAGAAQRFDLADCCILPGLFQSHFHSGFGHFGSGTQAPMLGLEAPTALLAMLAVHNAGTALDAGVTSLIGSSNPDYLDVNLREAILHGYAEGPRIWAGSHELTASGAQEDGENRSWFMRLGNHGVVWKLDGADAFRRATREELGRGCDVIKVALGPGHGASPAEERCNLTDAELEAVVETAHDRGRFVRAHAPSKRAILASARIGVDIIDHADRIDAECIDAVVASGAAVCPTGLWNKRFLEFAENWDTASQGPMPIGDGFPETPDETARRIRGVRADYEHSVEMLPELVRAGIPLLAGDDFGTPLLPHGDYVAELETYVKDFGIEASEVLLFATRNPARTMRCGDSLGQVAAGFQADLLVVEGDPSNDIGALRRVRAVIQSGRVVRGAL